MKLLDRYFIGRLSAISVYAIIIFTLAWLAPETLFKVIQGVADHEISLLDGLNYLAYQIPVVLTYCLPISMLFGCVFFVRQISLSGELIAVLSSGISIRRILLPIGMVGLGMSFLFILTQEALSPWAATAQAQMQARTHFNVQEVTEGPLITFVEKNRDGTMEKFIIISPDAKRGENQFILLFYAGQGDTTHISRIVTARRGVWDRPNRAWLLMDGVNYMLTPEGIYREVKPFQSTEIHTTSVVHEMMKFHITTPSQLNTWMLDRYAHLLIRGGQTEEAKFYQVRFYQRLFLPWVPLLFALLGVGIGVEKTRARRNLGLTYSAMLLLSYNIIVDTTTTIGSIGAVPPAIAAFLPLLAASLLGWFIIQIRRSEG